LLTSFFDEKSIKKCLLIFSITAKQQQNLTKTHFHSEIEDRLVWFGFARPFGTNDRTKKFSPNRTKRVWFGLGTTKQTAFGLLHHYGEQTSFC
jgi:hypothetical protein